MCDEQENTTERREGYSADNYEAEGVSISPELREKLDRADDVTAGFNEKNDENEPTPAQVLEQVQELDSLYGEALKQATADENETVERELTSALSALAMVGVTATFAAALAVGSEDEVAEAPAE